MQKIPEEHFAGNGWIQLSYFIQWKGQNPVVLHAVFEINKEEGVTL